LLAALLVSLLFVLVLLVLLVGTAALAALLILASALAALLATLLTALTLLLLILVICHREYSYVDGVPTIHDASSSRNRGVFRGLTAAPRRYCSEFEVDRGTTANGWHLLAGVREA
jgi:hypothetical protein